jgi:heme/copper-type cytochrome/quinol oxidase subunit 2
MISKWFRLFAAAAVGLAAGAAVANPYNLPEPQTLIAREIYDLHTLLMWIIVGIFVVVFGAMTYAIVRHRKSVGHEATQFHKYTTVEIVWTIIPFFILIGMAYPAIKTLIAMKDPSRPELTIKPAAMVSFKHLSDADIAAFHLHAHQLGQQDRRSGHPGRRRIFAEVSTQ